MAPQALSPLLENFVYQPDGKIDTWNLIRPNSQGQYVGDCDDFAITAAYFMSDRNWLKFWWNVFTLKFVFWFVTSPGGYGHAALWVRGYGWICNIDPFFQPKTRSTRRLPYWVLIVIKMIIGKIFGPR